MKKFRLTSAGSNHVPCGRLAFLFMVVVGLSSAPLFLLSVFRNTT